MEVGEVLPVIEHLAALLIKMKSKAEALQDTVHDAKQVFRWAERTTREMKFFPMPKPDAERIQGAIRDCLQEAMEALERLVEEAACIADTAAGDKCGFCCMGSMAVVHFNKGTFEEAKETISKVSE